MSRSDERFFRESERGFTLIELLIVIMIISLLAGIAIPAFLSQRRKGYDSQARSDLRNFAAAEETYLVNNPSGYGPAGAVLGSGFKMSPNDVIVLLGLNGASGFCAYGKNLNSSNYFLYDSQSGGLASTSANAAPTVADCSSSSVGSSAPSTTTLTASAAGMVSVH